MIQEIEIIICEQRGILPEEIHNESRKTDCRLTRQIIMYFARKFTKMSLYQIGNYFDRTHATVISSLIAIDNLIETDKKFKADIDKYWILIEEVAKIAKLDAAKAWVCKAQKMLEDYEVIHFIAIECAEDLKKKINEISDEPFRRPFPNATEHETYYHGYK